MLLFSVALLVSILAVTAAAVAALMFRNRLQTRNTINFFLFVVLSLRRQLADYCRRAADTIRLGFGLGFVHGGDFADLIEVAVENSRVGKLFGGFGELEEHDAGADLQEA